MKSMKSIFLLSAFLALGLAIPADAAAQRREREDDQEYRSRIDTTFAFNRNGVVDLTLVSGDIIVTGWSRDEARVRATSERGLLRAEFSSSRISLDIQSVRGRMGDTRYEVSVPAGARVITRSTSGDLSVRGVKGPVEARTTSGDVEVDEATDRITLESVSGGVRGTRLTGEVRAESVSGSVELERVSGDIRVESTSGDITIADATSRNVFSTTVSGEVEYVGSIEQNGRYEFHSHSGSIRLEIPGNAGARFSVETFSGSLDSDFDITLQPGDRGTRRPRRFEFTIGNGGARVTAETFSGDITLGRATARSNR